MSCLHCNAVITQEACRAGERKPIVQQSCSHAAWRMHRLPALTRCAPRNAVLRKAYCAAATNESALIRYPETGHAMLNQDGSMGDFFPEWVRRLPLTVKLPLDPNPKGPVIATLVSDPELCHGGGVTGYVHTSSNQKACARSHASRSHGLAHAHLGLTILPRVLQWAIHVRLR